MATIVGDVTGLQQSHHPLNIPHLVKKIKGFPLKVKSFRNTAIYQKLRGGVPSPPLVPRWGMNLRVRPRVKKTDNRKWTVWREKLTMSSYHCTLQLHLQSSWFFPSERIAPLTIPFPSLLVVRGDPGGQHFQFYQHLLFKRNHSQWVLVCREWRRGV